MRTLSGWQKSFRGKMGIQVLFCVRHRRLVVLLNQKSVPNNGFVTYQVSPEVFV